LGLFEGRLEKISKNSLIEKHGFGISDRKGESFGIAVSEMIKAGEIVLVSDNGGRSRSSIMANWFTAACPTRLIE